MCVRESPGRKRPDSWFALRFPPGSSNFPVPPPSPPHIRSEAVPPTSECDTPRGGTSQWREQSCACVCKDDKDGRPPFHPESTSTKPSDIVLPVQDSTCARTPSQACPSKPPA